MSKKQFDAAKELIDRRQYAEARAILKTIDHPTARAWETKLDQRDPSTQSFDSSVYVPPPPIGSPPETPPAKDSRFRPTTGCLIIVAIIAVVYMLWPNKPLVPAASLSTSTNTPTVTPTATATATATITPSPTATEPLRQPIPQQLLAHPHPPTPLPPHQHPPLHPYSR